MKKISVLLVLVFFMSLFTACTPTSINENDELEVYETGGDNSAELDNDKDPNGD